MARRTPTESEIKQVMEETGMDHLQARNHLIQRFTLQEIETARRIQQLYRNEQQSS